MIRTFKAVSLARSRLMASVRQKGTNPELIVRRLARLLGLRIRTNGKNLPGSPDVFTMAPKRAVFVHGCFWHRHPACKAATMPKSNREFWEQKFKANLQRDRRKIRKLRSIGFRVMTIWECQVKSPTNLSRVTRKLLRFFETGQQPRKDIPSQKAESFTLSKDGRRIYRDVQRRTGKTIRTRFSLGTPVKRVTSRSQDFLAKSIDLAFLRSEKRPVSKDNGRIIRVADLFSGCGAMSIGVQEACRALGLRFRPVISIDFDRRTTDVYKANFPTAKVHTADIRHLLVGRLGFSLTPAEKKLKKLAGRIDVAVAGPPCQGHSDLNNYTRRRDPKNGLYYRIVRFAKIVKPRNLIIENVPAVVHDRGRVVSRAKKALEALHYKVQDGVLDLTELGVPQTRRRHVLIASLKHDIDLDHLISNSYAKKRSLRWAIADLVKRQSDSAMDRWPGQTKAAKRRIQYLFKHEVHDLPNRLRPPCHRYNNHTYSSVYGRLRWEQPAQTITTGFMCMGQGRFVHPKQPRTLTPREAARLQFIPDFFSFGDKPKAVALADMIGNAVPTKLTYVLALELLR
jgi:DNA (cytosine-5)-methyltransferase 1